MKYTLCIVSAIAFVFAALPAQAAPQWTDHNSHDPGVAHRGGTGDLPIGVGARGGPNQSDLDFLKERARRTAESAVAIRGWDPEKKEKIERHKEMVSEDAGATITFGDGEHGARVKVQFPWER